MNRIAVVTGANRGIGREVARQLADMGDTVYLTARNLADADAAVADLGSPTNLRSHQLDVTDPRSIDRLAVTIEADHLRLDMLINNAAILYDTWQRASQLTSASSAMRSKRICLVRGGSRSLFCGCCAGVDTGGL